MKKAFIIYNFAKKRNYFLRNLDNLLLELEKLEYETLVYATKGPQDCIKKLASIEYHDLIVCAGGDGTINEVVNGIANWKVKPKVLYFPIGTINDFAASLKIKKSISYGINMLKNDQCVEVDTGIVNGKLFNYIVASGHFVASSYETTNQQKTLFGRFAYFLTGIKDLGSINKFYNVEITLDDNEVIKDSFRLIFITNTKSMAGVRKMFPENKMNDGRFHLLLFTKKRTLIKLLRAPRIILWGVHKYVNSDDVIYREFSSLKLKSLDEPNWSLDGERGPVGDLNVEILEKNLKIFGTIE